MPSFIFCQTQDTFKVIPERKQVTDVFKIDVNKVVAYNRVPCNNGNK